MLNKVIPTHGEFMLCSSSTCTGHICRFHENIFSKEATPAKWDVYRNSRWASHLIYALRPGLLVQGGRERKRETPVQSRILFPAIAHRNQSDHLTGKQADIWIIPPPPMCTSHAAIQDNWSPVWSRAASVCSYAKMHLFTCWSMGENTRYSRVWDALLSFREKSAILMNVSKRTCWQLYSCDE